MKKLLISLFLVLTIILSSCDVSIFEQTTQPESPSNPTEQTSPTDAPTERPTDSPDSSEGNTEHPTDSSTPSESNTERPTDSSTPSESSTERPTDSSTPSESSTESPTDAPSNNGCVSHTDDDDNGTCDVCAVSVMVTIDFYAINDLHGKFSDTDSDEGVDELTAYLKKHYASDDYYVTLSSGDMWQGGSESNLTKGLIITEWLGHIGTVSMTLGNHEFDWGEEYVYANAEIAQFPFLAINIYDRDTNQLAEYCSPSVVIERGGIKIGIIGAIGDCYSSISPDKVEGIYFKTGSQLTQLVKAESERLRAQGVDYIVYSIHEGYEQNHSGTTSVSSGQLASYYNSELSSGGYVDIVFEGHTHKNYVIKDTYGVYHLQDGGDNRGISHVEISINSVTNSSVVNKAEFIEDDTYMYSGSDPIVDDLRAKYKDQIALGDRVVGKNLYYRNSDYLRQLVADLYYEKGLKIWGEEYDVVLGGGFISVRSPYYLSAGDVTYSQLQSLFPFDNHLVLCSIKGSDLKSKFINTTNDNYFISYKDGLTLSIDNNKTYYIVVDSYTSSYAPNRLTEIARYDIDMFARDLLADYIEQGGLE